jgi:hypothetical protein
MIKVTYKTVERSFECDACRANPTTPCECLLDALAYERKLGKGARVFRGDGALLASCFAAETVMREPGKTGLGMFPAKKRTA